MNFTHLNEAQSPFLGSGDHIFPSNILTSPKLCLDTDKLLWREVVYNWAENLQACGSGGDTRATGAAATLGITVYRSLEFSKKEIVKKAVRTGEIILNPRGDKHATDQTAVVKKIVDLVAKDSTVDRLRRIVRLYNKINSCKRKENESIGEYIERFAGPAFSYLNFTNADQDSSDSQNFAIILLLNASLSPQTFRNISSNLVASSRVKKSDNIRTMQISIDRANMTITLLAMMKSKDPDHEHLKDAESCVTTLTAAIKEHEKNYDQDEDSAQIGLQDAICALEEAGLEEKDLQDSAQTDHRPGKTSKSFLNSYNAGKG